MIVGNDPFWEAGGAYADSNIIINKLLDSLGSRMNIYPANTLYDSLGALDQESNTISSFTPEGSISHSVETSKNFLCSGVGDIRIHWPENHNSDLYSLDKTSRIGLHAEANVEFNCSSIDGNYYVFNNYCSMPLVDGGDLRSQWVEPCESLDLSLIHI